MAIIFIPGKLRSLKNLIREKLRKERFTVIVEGDIIMFERFKKTIFKIIPPSRRFMDRKFEENEELVRSTMIQETEHIHREILDVAEEFRNSKEHEAAMMSAVIQETVDMHREILDVVEEFRKSKENDASMMSTIIQETANIHREILDVTEEFRKNNLLYADLLKELKDALNQANSNQEKLHQRQDDIIKLINAVGDNENLKQDARYNEIAKLIKSSFDETAKSINDQIVDVTSKIAMNQNNLMDKYNIQTDKITQLGRTEEENTWANVFHDVIKDSVWLQNKAFAPGRWAAGYQMLYVMYRILDSVKPKKILELGLGQTTRMISQYSGYYHAEHQVVEHDPKWIEFFATSYEVPDNVKFVNLETIVDKYLDDEAVIMYRDFEEQFRGQKFDFICIDAPIGGKAIKYARVDILKIIPECLETDFAILIDDTTRIGENNTIKLLQKIFEENGIEHVTKRYEGKKSSTIFTTEKYSFLTSL